MRRAAQAKSHTMKPIVRSILVNVQCVAGQAGSVKFPDVAELREGVEVVGMEAYNVVDLTNTPDGAVVISAADALLCTVTLTDKSELRVRNIPHSTLIPRINGGIWKEFAPFLVNFQRSTLTFGAAAAAGAAFSAPFTIYYRKLTDRG